MRSKHNQSTGSKYSALSSYEARVQTPPLFVVLRFLIPHFFVQAYPCSSFVVATITPYVVTGAMLPSSNFKLITKPFSPNRFVAAARNRHTRQQHFEIRRRTLIHSSNRVFGSTGLCTSSFFLDSTETNGSFLESLRVRRSVIEVDNSQPPRLPTFCHRRISTRLFGTSSKDNTGDGEKKDSNRSTTFKSSSATDRNKRANLPFSIMDQEIEQYATKVRGGGVDNSNGYAHNGNNMRQPQEKHVKPQRTVTEYEKWVRRLYATNLFLPVKLGLENMEQLHEALGRPTDRMIIVHIAGTNGKGSVTYKIAKTLREANPNLRVGLFCSPHISSFRERMQVNDELITEDQVVQLLPPIYEICQERDIPGTFFEITTALAFSYYASMKCDVVVLETGLGGRLDATNIVRKPAISIITSIGLEHTRILGDTIELIAVEKGGIIKENCPVLVGPNVPHIVLRQCAKDKKASGYYTCDDVLGLPNKKSTEVEADYDKENARIATAALKLLQKSPYGVDLGIQDSLTDRAIAKGTSQRPPCRFETLQVPLSDDEDENMLTVILDVAHNPPAMDYLKRKLRHSFPSTRIRVVVGMSSDKDMKLCGLSVISVVEGDTSRIHLVEAAHPRAAKLEAILDATGLADTDVHYDLNDRSITTQIRKAKTEIIQRMQQPTKKKVKEPQEVLVVCGSVFLMAEAREALGINEPRDSDVIAELAGAGVRHSQENFGNNKSYEDNMDDGPRNK